MGFITIALLFLSIYLFLFGLAMVLKNKELGNTMERLSENDDFYAAMVPVGALVTALGVVFLLLFQDPLNGTGLYSTLVYLAIWAMILKGLVYLFIPSCYIKKVIKCFSSPKKVRIVGIVTAFVGIVFVHTLISFLGLVSVY